MWKAIRRWWKYLGARLSGKLEESADPKTQLEQAIEEAQQQHRRLTEQAANVIANQKQTQMRLERAVEEYEKSNASARQALLLADEATRDGKSDKVASYTQAAEAFADKIIALERQDLLSQLDQAKMQEQMNKAMAQLSATVGEDVPTFEQVRDKIERRLAKAQGMADLTTTNVDAKMLEVEQAQASAEAQARLSELRSELGLASPEAEKPAAEPAPKPAEAEKPAEKPSS